MSKVQVAAVSDAVHKLQLALLDGIQDETQLFTAGSLMSRSDYEDIVTERSISKICGYPLCPNALPSERPRKSHYRISLEEHKVYDLHETYMYCSSSCLINSRAFAGSLQNQRCLVLNPAKLNEILSLFKNLGVESGVMGKNGDLGISKLSIQEKTDIKGGEVSLEEWIGPSDAIEGYVPQRDRNAKPSSSKATKEDYEPDGAKLKLIKQNDAVHNNLDFKVDVISNEDKIGPRNAPANEKYSGTNQSKTSKPLLSEMDFTSTIITNDEFTVSEKLDGGSKSAHSNVARGGSKQKKSGSKKGKDPIFCDMDFMSTIITQDEYCISKPAPSQVISEPNQISRQFAEKLGFGNAEKQPKSWEDSSGPAENDLQSSMDECSGMGRVSYHSQDDANSSTTHVNGESRTEQALQSSLTTFKSSLRTSRARRAARSVTWADEKSNGPDGGNLCEIREFKNTKEGPRTGFSKEAGDDDDDYARFALAEACAAALNQAAEAVASGQSDVSDAVSEAGIIVLPHPQQADEGEDPRADDALKETASPKLNSDSNDSWFDAPPEEFSLTLSPFATMWNALFSWMTSSSLACIYGRDESSQEEYLFVNGREYPGKIVLPDGRSSEIKQTLAGCLARALPGVIALLKLPTPVSTLEQGLACLLDTMSFMDALPPFRLKQWQVIVLLFIDALSICRIPGLTPYLTSRRILIPKVLDGAQITAQEYEIMKDLVIPLGRVPHFSMQSGG